MPNESFFLGLKVFNSNSFYIFSFRKNAQVTFVENRQLKMICFKNYKHWYLIHTWSDWQRFEGYWWIVHSNLIVWRITWNYGFSPLNPPSTALSENPNYASAMLPFWTSEGKLFNLSIFSNITGFSTIISDLLRSLDGGISVLLLCPIIPSYCSVLLFRPIVPSYCSVLLFRPIFPSYCSVLLVGNHKVNEFSHKL